jgi:hypothetical protein
LFNILLIGPASTGGEADSEAGGEKDEVLFSSKKLFQLTTETSLK